MRLLGWAVTSNDRALANARAAAVECSRRRLERAEVVAFLEGLEPDQRTSRATVDGVAAVTPLVSVDDRPVTRQARAR